ncbi:hypothetical protein HEK616_83370 (plasmid) [Streptomyces nigrescens]|uniref:Secreted protein n=2 Tax=Streptomyces TaxID=1883 RepID=A0ABM8A877_STRNI|nr:hypothetical protein [Streptomyces nigrescens]MEE4423570.1 hypothetical protein [Streptomyces sp. DSM 41528]BDM74850.1 hypothetical protein HEK616_83370 [Streptomyces nigrescens]
MHSVGRRRFFFPWVVLEGAALQRPVALLAHRVGLPCGVSGGLLRGPPLPRFLALALALLLLLFALLLAELVAPALPLTEGAFVVGVVQGVGEGLPGGVAEAERTGPSGPCSRSRSRVVTRIGTASV